MLRAGGAPSTAPARRRTRASQIPAATSRDRSATLTSVPGTSRQRDCGSRLLRSALRARITRGRSIRDVIARVRQESFADGHHPIPPRPDVPHRRRRPARPPLGRALRATARPPSSSRTPSARGEGVIAAEGPLVVRTGKHTGRSPRGQVHRRRAREPRQDLVGRRQPADQSEAHYERLRARLVAYCADRDLYARTASSAPTRRTSAACSVITETAWASIFARNLFRRTTADRARRLRRRIHDHLRAVASRRTPPPRAPARDGHPRPPRADGDPHRRDRVRGRDQEVARSR